MKRSLPAPKSSFCYQCYRTKLPAKHFLFILTCLSQYSVLTELLSKIEMPSSYRPSWTQAAQFWGPELVGTEEAQSATEMPALENPWAVCSAHNPAPHCSFFDFLIFDQTNMSTVQDHKNSQMRSFNVEKGIRAWTCKANHLLLFLFEFVISGIKLRFHECQVSALSLSLDCRLRPPKYMVEKCRCVYFSTYIAAALSYSAVTHVSHPLVWHSIYPPRAAQGS